MKRVRKGTSPTSATEAAFSKGRRSFLKSAAFAPAVLAGAGSASARPASIPPGPAVDALKMPQIQLAGRPISRLIMGANPQGGFSHRGKLLSRLMTEWYTLERAVEVLHHAERCGINTWQAGGGSSTLDVWEKYRSDGGRMNLILLTHPTREEWLEERRRILPLKPLALVHHGGDTDKLWRENKMDRIKDALKGFRDDGVLVGCSSHNPEVLQEIASRGWDVDLFMTCMYEVSKPTSEWKDEFGFTPKHEMYTEEMPARMVQFIQSVKQPCLAFKILAAGRACDQKNGIENAFKFAFQEIKPSDGVIVGMFPKFSDQIAEDANLAIKYGGLA